jgi:hypothetical protein
MGIILPVKAAEGQPDRKTAHEMTTGFSEGMAAFEKAEIPTGTSPRHQGLIIFGSRAVSGGSPLDAFKQP